MIKFKTFKTRISVPIFLSIVIFGTIATTTGGVYAYDNILNSEKQHLVKNTRAKADEVSFRMSHLIDITSKIAKEPNIIKFYSTNSIKNTDEINHVSEYIRHYSIGHDILEISLLDLNGDAIISTGSNIDKKNHSSENYFKKAITGFDYVEANISIKKNDYSYYFSSPIKENNIVVGAIIVKVGLEYIEVLMKSDPSNGIIFADKNGVVLSSTNNEELFHTIGGTSKKSAIIIDTDVRYKNSIKSSLGYDELQSDIDDGYFISKIYNSDNNKDKSEILSLVKVSGSPFYVIYKVETEKFIVETLKVTFVISGLIIASAFMALLCILLIIDKSIQPLKILEESTKKIGSGDFNTKIDIDTADEFRTLANTIMQMEVDLRESYQSLENKVKDKTADLLKFQLAVASTSEHITITNPKGIILFANKAVTDITGFSNIEIIGFSVGKDKLWGGQMPKDFYENLWDTISVKKKPFTGIIINKRKNGSLYNAATIISPIINDKNEILYYISTQRDITKEIEVDKTKTEFVSLASHQLRTPLSAINWYTEMLLAGDAGKINETQKEYLNEIYHGNQRMVELVNALLNVSRLDLGTFEINPMPMRICEIIEDVGDEMKHLLKEKNQTFLHKCSKNIPEINADSKLLRIIFQNLISNAIKYTPERGKISISAEYDELTPKNAYTIKVSDTGFGIPKDQTDRIFSKLFRADNVRAMDTEGTGLGLYIIKSILDKSGGSISFESVENKGTTFIIKLPKTGMKQKTGSKSLSQEKIK